MKKLVLLALLVTLVSCGDPTISQKNIDTPLPDGLQDCKFYLLSDPTNNFGNAKIIRCPNSTVSATYRVGKSQRTTVTFDGAQYLPLDDPKPAPDTIEIQGKKFVRAPAEKGN